MRILFVCLGNICRSPLAEALFNHHLKLLGKDQNFIIDSCGTNGFHNGELADSRTRKSAESKGISITHQSRQIKLSDLDTFDHILVMDDKNLKTVIALSPDKSEKVHLITHFSEQFKGQIIPDPYFGDEKGFDDVFELLNDVNKELAQYFCNKYQ